MAPSAHITESDHLKGAHSEGFTIGVPLNRSDDLIVSCRAIKLSAEAVPNSVLAIFSTRDDSVVCRTPVTLEDDPVMSFPVNHFLARNRRLNVQVLS